MAAMNFNSPPQLGQCSRSGSNTRLSSRAQLSRTGPWKLFTYKDACVERGPHLGYDSSSTQAAKTAVKAFLSTLFKLE
jgi:hypothetical protein